MATVEKYTKPAEKSDPVIPEQIRIRKQLLEDITATYTDEEHIAMGPVHTLIGQPFHYVDSDFTIVPEDKDVRNDILVEALNLVLEIRRHEKTDEDWWNYFEAHENEEKFRFLMIEKYQGIDLRAIGMFQVLLHPNQYAKNVVQDTSIQGTITERSKRTI